jgi:hypothetical protein
MAEASSFLEERFVTLRFDGQAETAEYYVDKDTGNVMITQKYALDIAKRDPRVKAAFERAPDIIPYYELGDKNFVIRLVSNNVEVMVVKVDFTHETVTNVHDKTFHYSR